MKSHLKKLHARPLSWSSLSLWDYSREKWIAKYLEDKPEPPNPQMLCGTRVHELLSVMPINGFRPDVPRFGIPNFEIKAKFGRIPLIGYFDFWNESFSEIFEIKTHEKKDKWTQAVAQDWGQLKFYSALLWLAYDIKPEDITSYLISLRVEESGNYEWRLCKEKCKVFPVKHTKVEILDFLVFVKNTYQEMEQVAKEYK